MRVPGSRAMHSSCIAYGASSTPVTTLGAIGYSGELAQAVTKAIPRRRTRLKHASFASSPPLRPPILDQHRPAIVIAPHARDFGVASRKTLARETGATNERRR